MQQNDLDIFSLLPSEQQTWVSYLSKTGPKLTPYTKVGFSLQFHVSQSSSSLPIHLGHTKDDSSAHQTPKILNCLLSRELSVWEPRWSNCCFNCSPRQLFQRALDTDLCYPDFLCYHPCQLWLNRGIKIDKSRSSILSNQVFLRMGAERLNVL